MYVRRSSFDCGKVSFSKNAIELVLKEMKYVELCIRNSNFLLINMTKCAEFKWDGIVASTH